MITALDSRFRLALRMIASGTLLIAAAACGESAAPNAPAGAGAPAPSAGQSSGGAGGALAGGPSGTAGSAGAATSASGAGAFGAQAGTSAAGAAGAAASAGAAGGASGAAGSSGAGGTDAQQPTACDRACLTGFNDSYLAALIANDATKLATAATVRFTENGKELPLDQGLWAVAEGLRTFRQDFAEVPAGQTAGFAALDDSDGVVLLAFRLKVVDRQVAEIETIVVRQGEATFFAPSSLTLRDPIYDAEVPMASRLPRAEMIEVVDEYFKGIETGNGSAISVDASAARNENGTVTARGSSIQNLAMFSYIEAVKRRYVLVDEERGIVLPLVLFEIPQGLGGSRTLHLAELFKVEGGKIMDILAIMVNQPLGTPSGWQ